MGQRTGVWFKSSHSPEDQCCVEVLFLAESAFVRHSRAPFGPILVFDRGEWLAFVAAVRDGQFDIPG
jgi:hypothetical protein